MSQLGNYSVSVESIVKTFLVCIFMTTMVVAKEQVVGRLYFNQFMGQLHKNPSISSSSLTSVQCGYSVKVIEDKDIIKPDAWAYVQVGSDKGFIQQKFLSQKRQPCFQGKYPKFVNGLNLNLTDLFFWGRLYDQYLMGESRAR